MYSAYSIYKEMFYGAVDSSAVQWMLSRSDESWDES